MQCTMHLGWRNKENSEIRRRCKTGTYIPALQRFLIAVYM